MNERIRRFGVADPDRYWRERQARGAVGQRRLHRFLAGRIDALCPAGGKVLDCGVGSGHVFRLCRGRHEMYGVETSAHAIAGYDFPTDNIRQADLNAALPDFGVRFDVILLSMLLHWLDDPARLLVEARDRLEPGGRVIAVIPNIAYYRHRLAYLFGKFPPISLSHRNFQTAAEFEEMARRCGLQIEKRTSPKRKLRARLWPTVFSQDLVYILTPARTDATAANR
ncbi:MAG TPA: class I SAM-dependent methyltransferase [Phycisphaerae bacterium]|nr:class I SAM-dependent methyltransferase [Phycisphaerae bacterium]